MTLSVGLIQVAIGLLRIGSLTAVVRDTVIDSFTVGASVHVATSQMRYKQTFFAALYFNTPLYRHFVGLKKVPDAIGPGRIVNTYIGLGIITFTLYLYY